MPAEFQKAIDLTLTSGTYTYAYIEDILIVTKGLLDVHKQKLQSVLKKTGRGKLGDIIG